MHLEFKELEKKDYKKAVQFAIKGMHFNWYVENKLLLNLYGRYFWYLEMTRATQIIALYSDGDLAGVLLAKIKGEPKAHHSFWKALYVKSFHKLQYLFAEDGVGPYDDANKKMYLQYSKDNSPDGEIIFLAADPEIEGKGIGSTLLHEFERREKGKQIYLYTDNACTYQFYEHRGFERVGEKEIILNIGSKNVKLLCLLYSKITAS